MAETMVDQPLARPLPTHAPARILIAGLGNPLMGDDGIGQEVVERLRLGGPLPDGVRAEMLAGDVLCLPDLWLGEPDVWLVDAVQGGGQPGELHVIEHRRLLSLPAEPSSAHHLSCGESLRWLLHARPDMAPVRFRLYGIEAGVVGLNPGLTAAVERAVNRLVASLRAAASA